MRSQRQRRETDVQRQPPPEFYRGHAKQVPEGVMATGSWRAEGVARLEKLPVQWGLVCMTSALEDTPKKADDVSRMA